MIEVSCPSSRMNNHQFLYNWTEGRTTLIHLNVDENGVKFEKELTVAEAEQLANDLMGWVREIKGDEGEESA